VRAADAGAGHVRHRDAALLLMASLHNVHCANNGAWKNSP
jgi:hypothetical protein